MKDFRLILLLAVGFIPFCLGAKQVSPENAQQVAEAQVRSRSQLRSGQQPELHLAYVAKAGSTAVGAMAKASGSAQADVLYYVFNLENKGFVIVSGDDIAKPILGYSDAGAYDPNNLPPNFVYWMNCLAQEIEQAIKDGIPQSEKTKGEWEAYFSGKVAGLRVGTAVEPLFGPDGDTGSIAWNQGAPYNNGCPMDYKSNKQSITGCVATAMAQIMRYHRYPAKGNGTIPAYTTDSLKIPIDEANIDEYYYKWENLLPQYPTSTSGTQGQRDSIADLMSHCGKSVRMDYSSDFSGASSINAGIALRDYFSYSPSITYKQRAFYLTEEWEDILRAQLDSHQPILYSGQDTGNQGGHTFVCDGYDESGNFHFNWGWGGGYNGNYPTTALDPPSNPSYKFDVDQDIVINIIPNTGGDNIYDLRTDISTPNTSLTRGEPFTVNAPIFNMGLSMFTGSIGIAIVDADNNVQSIIGEDNSISFYPASVYYSGYYLNCVIPTDATIGDCNIKVVYKSSDASEWSFAKAIPNGSDILTLTIVNDPVLPVENLEASLDNNKVTLNWDAPFTGGTLTYAPSTAVPSSNFPISNPNENTATEAIRFDSNDLKSMKGYDVTKVCFYPGNNPTATYTIQIWSGGNESSPGTLIYEQQIETITNGEWNDISLTSPIPINIYEDLRIGILITNTDGSGNFLIPYYSDGVAWKSSCYNNYPNSTGWTFVTISNGPPILWPIWPISATIEPDASTPTLSAYKISRNDEDIATIANSESTYEDLLSTTGSYTYCITAQYSLNSDKYESTSVCSDAVEYTASNNIAWIGAEDNNWNAPENWNAGQIPQSMDTVVISAGAPNFPVLQSNVTVAAICFEPGAQIGGQHYLTGKAFVQYDLSARNRWNMLSMPLQEAYPGDFTFGGYPLTWVRTFETAAGDGGTTKGSWNTARKSTTAFTAGDAFVLWLNADNNYPDQVPTDVAQKGIKLLNNVLELPYFYHHATADPEYALYQSVQPTQDYDGSKSTFYNFALNTGTGKYERLTNDPGDPTNAYQVNRSESAYQLAGESVAKTLNFGENTEAGGNVALVGNPYMASLNFDDLYTANSSVIKPSYQVWTGSGYGVYTGTGSAGALEPTLTGSLIAPLQGFLVEKSDGASSSSLNFTETMATAEATTLRSSANIGDKLDIVARNSVGGVLTFIAKREGGQDSFGDLDARKIINDLSDIPEVYTLKPYKDKTIAAAVNIIGNDDLVIPIGLATSYTGNITLSFSGMDSYNAKLSLIDVETNKEIDLTGLASYDYDVNYTPKTVNGSVAVCEDRFFIRISKAMTGLQETLAETVKVFETNGGLIQIISSASNPIKEAAVYDLQGALKYKESAIHAASHTINKHWPAGVYIVKVISENTINNVKLIIQ